MRPKAISKSHFQKPFNEKGLDPCDMQCDKTAKDYEIRKYLKLSYYKQIYIMNIQNSHTSIHFPNFKSANPIQRLHPALPSKKISVQQPLGMHIGHSRHMQIHSPSPIGSSDSSFIGMLKQGIQKVEQLETHAKDLQKKSVYDPNSVEIHELMIAAEKSKFALNLTKTLADSFIRGFKELSSPR